MVYKAETLDPSWTVGGPEGARYTVSSSGWMETAQFHEWFLKVFLPAVQDRLKQVQFCYLLMDIIPIWP